ncbi:hypothetical protein PG999_008014 [Apiospora kogelbergensis]|uniref:Uncharacterized protein n=1 Tax=Apiospora kogelbergensis TaxID=1337665 RepID=A0AAW0QNS8_9PEZI
MRDNGLHGLSAFDQGLHARPPLVALLLDELLELAAEVAHEDACLPLVTHPLAHRARARVQDGLDPLDLRLVLELDHEHLVAAEQLGREDRVPRPGKAGRRRRAHGDVDVAQVRPALGVGEYLPQHVLQWLFPREGRKVLFVAEDKAAHGMQAVRAVFVLLDPLVCSLDFFGLLECVGGVRVWPPHGRAQQLAGCLLDDVVVGVVIEPSLVKRAAHRRQAR